MGYIYNNIEKNRHSLMHTVVYSFVYSLIMNACTHSSYVYPRLLDLTHHISHYPSPFYLPYKSMNQWLSEKKLLINTCTHDHWSLGVCSIVGLMEPPKLNISVWTKLTSPVIQTSVYGKLSEHWCCVRLGLLLTFSN